MSAEPVGGTGEQPGAAAERSKRSLDNEGSAKAGPDGSGAHDADRRSSAQHRTQAGQERDSAAALLEEDKSDARVVEGVLRAARDLLASGVTDRKPAPASTPKPGLTKIERETQEGLNPQSLYTEAASRSLEELPVRAAPASSFKAQPADTEQGAAEELASPEELEGALPTKPGREASVEEPAPEEERAPCDRSGTRAPHRRVKSRDGDDPAALQDYLKHFEEAAPRPAMESGTLDTPQAGPGVAGDTSDSSQVPAAKSSAYPEELSSLPQPEAPSESFGSRERTDASTDSQTRREESNRQRELRDQPFYGSDTVEGAAERSPHGSTDRLSGPVGAALTKPGQTETPIAQGSFPHDVSNGGKGPEPVNLKSEDTQLSKTGTVENRATPAATEAAHRSSAETSATGGARSVDPQAGKERTAQSSTLDPALRGGNAKIIEPAAQQTSLGHDPAPYGGQSRQAVAHVDFSVDKAAIANAAPVNGPEVDAESSRAQLRPVPSTDPGEVNKEGNVPGVRLPEHSDRALAAREFALQSPPNGNDVALALRGITERERAAIAWKDPLNQSTDKQGLEVLSDTPAVGIKREYCLEI